ncbi:MULTISPECIES: mechanosensitive ion channel domain-containing protein [unclassified Mycolicibacterium]|uniref:mechanosensitive ion channel domain-containing protein n=1 Tax=unclassified Mycolicibacterium TaxID=2636767 RepID=UPI001309AEF1|nr:MULTISPECIES: mechanosensitive ion channel domain-containing protein [unclassified Mycolicibacterium]MUL85501.1 mechanosensitive ion channel [Mycolicibacterium sp. CBMA 329]MUL88735.1 mechanosensitive ion channel [Mycolicibacterium sp. CBMA 331]MUM01971.1 mechanosensitive ion channel [Mycolicibacterium sp. CBMA 334]MUM29240.1 mechanosensitive ion channel [Mycolicibacterium sp. CBMA 295]MUM40382.1 mechanosensitive ion channel [Mycolicibacterium sp. CBMA 247]
MRSVLDADWFYWALAVAIGLPVGLVLLTELHNALTRRGSYLARPVGLLRNYILPLGALLILLVKGGDISGEATTVRIIATAFGFVVLILLLSGLNAALFQGAPEGSWRKRIPSIFLDVARFALIAIGVGMIFAYVWGANVGGLFTALGVTSIVLGLALQNAVGQIISGLLLLFEQPFQLGDWLDTPSARGRVVEVNWRATHIDTGSGMQIMPNSVLAGASFTNLSRPELSHSLSIVSAFGTSDAPDRVCELLTQTAVQLPQRRSGAVAKAVPLGGNQYKTTIPLRTPADDAAARATFLRWIWYAARRAELHLDGVDDEFASAERVDKAVRQVAPTLRLSHTEQQELLSHATLTRFGADEAIQAAGEIPGQMTFIVQGQVQVTVVGDGGAVVPVRVLDEGEFLGQTTLTREGSLASAYALGETTVLQVDRDFLEELVLRNPRLLHEIGRAIEERRANVKKALTAAAR